MFKVSIYSESVLDIFIDFSKAFDIVQGAIFFSQVYSLYFFLILAPFWWFGFLGLGFSVDGVWGLWCGAFWVFLGWCSLYKHKRINLGKKMVRYQPPYQISMSIEGKTLIIIKFMPLIITIVVPSLILVG